MNRISAGKSATASPRLPYPGDRHHSLVKNSLHEHALILVDLWSERNTSSPPTKRGPRGGVYDPFPIKLHRMLDQTKKEGLESIVSWLPHGRAFKIHKPKAFAESIMPNFFNQSKYTSFQRQLNLYGFSRCCRGQDAGAYYHELFLRGRPNFAKGLLRTKVKGNGHKTTKIHYQDPDFYAMAPLAEDENNNAGSVDVPKQNKCYVRTTPPSTKNQQFSCQNMSQTFSYTKNDKNLNVQLIPDSDFIPTPKTPSPLLNPPKRQVGSSSADQHYENPFLQELNQSIFIHELAVGCTILCQLRTDTKL